MWDNRSWPTTVLWTGQLSTEIPWPEELLQHCDKVVWETSPVCVDKWTRSTRQSMNLYSSDLCLFCNTFQFFLGIPVLFLNKCAFIKKNCCLWKWKVLHWRLPRPYQCDSIHSEHSSLAVVIHVKCHQCPQRYDLMSLALDNWWIGQLSNGQLVARQPACGGLLSANLPNAIYRHIILANVRFVINDC